MEKSVKLNAVLLVIKTVLSFIFPLITFPYISRVLLVDKIGQFNFASSVISYFVLIAGLGISTYAIREGSKVRDDKEKINCLISEIFAINVISTSIAISLLIVSIELFPKLQNYSLLLFILSFQLLFILYGRSWIYNIYENFAYITVIQVIFQILSVVLMFLCVHKPEDVYYYAIIHVISSSGPNILYGIHSRKFATFARINFSNLKKHIKPILIIFSTSIATTIYVNSDMTILGWLVDDRSVGLYSTAVKIYNMIKQVMVAVITVTIPRLTLFANTDKFKHSFAKVYNMLFFMSIPAMVGLMFMSKNIIYIISSSEYLDATISLQLLSIALVFALLACLFGLSVLLPNNKENVFLGATVSSAVINIIFNFILIPIYKQNAAAFTTVISQAIAFIICGYASKKYVDMKLTAKSSLQVLLGGVGIAITCLVIKKLGLGLCMETVFAILTSVIVYIVIEALLKNEIFFETLNSLTSIKNKLKSSNPNVTLKSVHNYFAPFL